MKTVTYLETGSTDPQYNLAFEEAILTGRMNGDYLILWQNDNAVIIGQNQNANAEINREMIEKRKISVVRRMTGGGAVYHDLGNLNYSFITELGNSEKLTIERFTEPVVRALKKLGLDAAASGRNDILISGRKVSGTAQRIYKNRILHHGTLLFDSDPDIISAVLKTDDEKFTSKDAKSVRSRIGNIRGFLNSINKDMGLVEFWTYLIGELAGEGFIRGSITQDEENEIMQLKESKYDNWEWNYGKAHEYNFKNKRRWPGGTLEVLIRIGKGGIVSDIKFFGDFLGRKQLDVIENELIGLRFREEDFSNVFNKYNKARDRIGTTYGKESDGGDETASNRSGEAKLMIANDYFGQISFEEVIQTIFSDQK